MDKKICVVSMSVGKPASMTAAWINNELIMAERTSYPERRRDMELQLLRELREKEEKGFIVLVEEENSFITGRVGQRVRLRDPFMNGRPVLIGVSLDIENYCTLSSFFIISGFFGNVIFWMLRRSCGDIEHR